MITINQQDALYLIPLLLILVSIVTGAYKKDYTLITLCVAMLLSGYLHQINTMYSMIVIYSSLSVLMLRSIANHGLDRWVKR